MLCVRRSSIHIHHLNADNLFEVAKQSIKSNMWLLSSHKYIYTKTQTRTQSLTHALTKSLLVADFFPRYTQTPYTQLTEKKYGSDQIIWHSPKTRYASNIYAERQNQNRRRRHGLRDSTLYIYERNASHSLPLPKEDGDEMMKILSVRKFVMILHRVMVHSVCI